MDPIADSRKVLKVLKFGSSVKIIRSRKLFERPPLRMAKQLRVQRIRPSTADAAKESLNRRLSEEDSGSSAGRCGSLEH